MSIGFAYNFSGQLTSSLFEISLAAQDRKDGKEDDIISDSVLVKYWQEQGVSIVENAPDLNTRSIEKQTNQGVRVSDILEFFKNKN